MSKPFNLQEAKNGRAVETKDGRPVRLFVFDLKGDYVIGGAYTDRDGQEHLAEWKENGSYFLNSAADGRDLVMKSVIRKREVWLNVYEDRCVAHSGQREAAFHAGPDRIACVPTTLEWEE